MAMIGLLPPKYLPTGEQTGNALRAVRFPTHTNGGRREESKGPVMVGEEARERGERERAIKRSERVGGAGMSSKSMTEA